MTRISLFLLVALCFHPHGRILVASELRPTAMKRSPVHSKESMRYLQSNGVGMYCDLCPNSTGIIAAQTIVPGLNRSCSELDKLNQNKSFSSAMCAYLQVNVASKCCAASIAPTRQPTSRPTKPVTTGPTNAKPRQTSKPRSPAPTPTPILMTTEIVIQMESVPAILDTPKLVSSFENDLETFLQNSSIQILLEGVGDIKTIQVTAEVVSQAQRSIQQRQMQRSSLRLNHRLTQNTEAVVNDVTVKVEGIVTSNEIDTGDVNKLFWKQVVIQAIYDNQNVLIEVIQQSQPDFYSDIVSIYAIDPETLERPSMSPTIGDSKNWFTTEVMLTIIVGTCVIILLLGFVWYLIAKKKKRNALKARGNADYSLNQDYFENDVDENVTIGLPSYLFGGMNNKQQQHQKELSSTTVTGSSSSIPLEVVSVMSYQDDVQTNVSSSSTNNSPSLSEIHSKQSIEPPGDVQFAPLRQTITTVKEKPTPTPTPTTTAKNTSSPETGRVFREKTITLPYGMLGIIIETHNEIGPRISDIMSGSPLEGQVMVGDIVVSIAGVDTRTMTGPDVANFLKYTSNVKERKMIILSQSQIGTETTTTTSIDRLIETIIESTQHEESLDDVETNTTASLPNDATIDHSIETIIEATKHNETIQETQINTKISIPATSNVLNDSASVCSDFVTCLQEEIMDVDAGMIAKYVVAPEGLLGLVLEANDDGLTVQDIHIDSPLEGKVTIGDILVSVNGIGCRRMSVDELSNLLVILNNDERQLVFFSRFTVPSN
jgi:hypothetical protein